VCSRLSRLFVSFSAHCKHTDCVISLCVNMLWYFHQCECMSATLKPVYMIQPIVKPVIKPVWQPVKCLYIRYNRLLNRLTTGCIMYTNPFDNQLYRVYSQLSHRLYNTVWQLVERTAAVRSTRLNQQWLFIQHGCQTSLTTGWQPVVSCKQGIKKTSHTCLCDEYLTIFWSLKQ